MPGARDANGVYQYAEDDVLYPFSGFMNKLASSLSTMLGPWQAWTPTLENATVGNGSLSGAFRQIGRTVHYRAQLTLGSTSTLTAGLLIVGVPRPFVSSAQLLGTGVATDASTGAARMIMARPWGAATAGIYLADGTAVSTGSPWTWAAGDSVHWSGTYEGREAP